MKTGIGDGISEIFISNIWHNIGQTIDRTFINV